MPRLTKAEKQQVFEKIEANLPLNQIKEEHNLTTTQMTSYVKQIKAKKNAEIILPYKPEEHLPVKETVEVPDRTYEIPVNQDEDELPPLFAEQQTTTSTELDENKDYCGNCYSQGNVVEIKKGQTICHKCGGVLEWGQ